MKQFRFAQVMSVSFSFISSKQLETVYYCMPPDDGRMTETFVVITPEE
jgi:hypothetical protein